MRRAAARTKWPEPLAGVADADVEQRVYLGGAVRRCVYALSHHGDERAVHQLFHQFGRRVVRAGLLALRSRREPEFGRRAWRCAGRQARVKIKQAFIYRAELFHINARVVDAPPCA